MCRYFREDIKTVFRKDPAARSLLEVLTCYPGLHALWWHRAAHCLWTHRMKYPARLISHVNRFFTGIEIHPEAVIGRRFFIDHGAGTVIGETSVIGDDVLIYQGVVLGGTTLEKKKRHPTLGNNVVVGVGAQLIGDITIGDNSKVGAGSVVVTSVPDHATVIGIPGRVVAVRNPDADTVERLPDPVWEKLEELQEKIARLEKRLAAAEGRRSRK